MLFIFSEIEDCFVPYISNYVQCKASHMLEMKLYNLAFEYDYIYYQNCLVFNSHLSGNKFLYFLYIVIIYLIMHYPLLVDTVKCFRKTLGHQSETVSITSHCHILESYCIVYVFIVHVLICDDNQMPISISRTGLQFEFGWKF